MPIMIGRGFVVYDGYDLEGALASVGKGWHPLLRELWNYLTLNPNAGTKVIQVKEKFGGLRIYLDSAYEFEHGLVRGLEMASYTICEACGSPGRERLDRSWTLTLCDSCDLKPRPFELDDTNSG